MAKLTIAVDDDLLKRARLRALKEGTSVDRVLRERLESYVQDDRPRRQRKAIRELLSLSQSASSGREGRRLRRDDVYGE
jgi:plasmid stability protein